MVAKIDVLLFITLGKETGVDLVNAFVVEDAGVLHLVIIGDVKNAVLLEL